MTDREKHKMTRKEGRKEGKKEAKTEKNKARKKENEGRGVRKAVCLMGTLITRQERPSPLVLVERRKTLK